jgi:hypothetical protein
MEKFRSLAQNSKFHKLVSVKNIDKETKEELVYTFTGGRTCSSAEMYFSEMLKLISSLEGKELSPLKPNNEVANKQRRRLISKFREMGYNLPNAKADMVKINATLSEHWGKTINEYSVAELSKIIGVIQRQWLPHYYKKNFNN